MKPPADVIRRIRARVETAVQDEIWEHAEEAGLSEDVSIDWGDEIVEAMMEAAESVDAPRRAAEAP